MKLYEINNRLEELLTQMEPDPETGELPEDCEDIISEILSLQANKAEIHEWLAKEALNARGEMVKIKAEIDRLKKLYTRYANRDERIVNILDRDCPEDEDYGFAKFQRRKSKKTEVTDYDKAFEWLSQHSPDCLKCKPADIDKMKVRKIITDGEPVPGVEIVENITVSLR